MVLDFLCAVNVFDLSVDDCKKNLSIICDNSKAGVCETLTIC